VALPTFAAVCHAAVQCQLLLTVRLMAMQQSIDIFWPPGHSSKPVAAMCGDRMGQTHKHMPNKKTLLLMLRKQCQ